MADVSWLAKSKLQVATWLGQPKVAAGATRAVAKQKVTGRKKPPYEVAVFRVWAPNSA
jgi:hypothetical protein